jgi:RHH-type proline utilization regulon transcriptional repressor/proline dehydrogenase/delta 1-pyrroline-5-carboxylate dehydrogenase
MFAAERPFGRCFYGKRLERAIEARDEDAYLSVSPFQGSAMPVEAPVRPFPALLFRAPFAEDDAAIARRLLPVGRLSAERERRVDATATRLIEAIRARGGGLGGVEDMLREYALSTKEGLALMVLAEALLRVPDAATADRLIEDKLGQGDFAGHESKSEAFLVSASAWALGITARVIQPGETPEGILGQVAKRIGLPAVRTATRQAMRVMGNHFVLGQNIADALKRAGSGQGRLYRYSFDMLGEGARTAEDARRYFGSYAAAIEAIGRSAGNEPLPNRPGISVKLSALHPRYDSLSHERVMRELVPLVVELAGKAKAYDLNFTVDAEEADRLELSLDVIAAVVANPSLADWDGLRLWPSRLPEARGRGDRLHRGHEPSATTGSIMVRLGEGRLWDTEVKRAQERGLDDYPVFTRKAMTDLNYRACAEKMLAQRPAHLPQFATHNALTVAVDHRARRRHGGLRVPAPARHGRGAVRPPHRGHPGAACRALCAGGRHRDLLAYLRAPPAGERRQLLLRVRGGRSRRAGHGAVEAPGRHRREPGRRAASEAAAAQGSLRAGARAIRAASSSAMRIRSRPPRRDPSRRHRTVPGRARW